MVLLQLIMMHLETKLEDYAQKLGYNQTLVDLKLHKQ